MSLSLASLLAEGALRYPAAPAVVAGSERVSYAELWQQARSLAAHLESRGIEAGDRVAILLPNVPDFPRAYYGILALGAVAVPIHCLLNPAEIAFVLGDAEVKALISAEPLLAVATAGAAQAGVPLVRSDRLPPDLEPVTALVERGPSDDAVILYTSGTTGKPKGARLSQLNMFMNAEITAHDICEATSGDVFLGCLPLFHSFGQSCVMNAAFRVGAAVVLMARFEGAAALELMVTENVTVFTGVPTMYIGLIAAARGTSRRPALRLAVSGGASNPVAVLEKFEELFGTPVYEGYGLSETSPVATFNQPFFGRKPGTVGCAIWGVRVEIARAEVEETIDMLRTGELGEIVIRGHNVFSGYLNNPAATAAAVHDGWFRSGDLGTKDADGFVRIVDRKKDMVLRGGYNVYPREVEEVLARHPSVGQVAVIGLPDPVHGEEICAVIIPSADALRVAASELIAWSKEHLAKYKYPRRVEFVDALPLGPSGKVLKRELVARFRES